MEQSPSPDVLLQNPKPPDLCVLLHGGTHLALGGPRPLPLRGAHLSLERTCPTKAQCVRHFLVTWPVDREDGQPVQVTAGWRVPVAWGP